MDKPIWQTPLKRLRTLMIAAISMFAMVLAVPVASAVDKDKAPKAALAAPATSTDGQMAQLLRAYPAATQIDTKTVKVKEGVYISLPSASPSAAAASCAYYDLCLWQNKNYGGYGISFTRCEFVDLGHIGFPTGGYWNDKLSSYINNQTSGTWSGFYNWTGSWDLWTESFAYEATPYIGDYYNDKIDGVYVC
ncbi:peptidase inhibitor family I36 protein [Streptomyces sp. NPDC001876]|uniref:peptidase inhibitor family I36 protein n=1 Tax=Streptomyces sp. NPDC001876 TaxID=3154402 RepID=UPI00331DF986